MTKSERFYKKGFTNYDFIGLKILENYSKEREKR